MIHTTILTVGTAGSIGGLGLMLLLFIAIGVGAYKGLKHLDRVARTHQIELNMRQAAKDADDQQLIAKKLLQERGL
jgi:hypothetical protein